VDGPYSWPAGSSSENESGRLILRQHERPCTKNEAPIPWEPSSCLLPGPSKNILVIFNQ
jgi:hypothetical protein